MKYIFEYSQLVLFLKIKKNIAGALLIQTQAQAAF